MHVNQFFETFQLINAVLILKKPHFKQEEMIKQQKESTMVRQDKGGKGGVGKRDRKKNNSNDDNELSKLDSNLILTIL